MAAANRHNRIRMQLSAGRSRRIFRPNGHLPRRHFGGPFFIFHAVLDSQPASQCTGHRRTGSVSNSTRNLDSKTDFPAAPADTGLSAASNAAGTRARCLVGPAADRRQYRPAFPAGQCTAVHAGADTEQRAMKEERAHALQSIRRVGRKLALLLIPLIRQLLARPETFWSAVTEGLENILLAVDC